VRRLLLAVLLVAACSAEASEDTVTVFAAASLRNAFAAEATAYETAHPGQRVELSVAGSQSLVAQVEQGAPADVLATADRATMELVEDLLVSGPELLAHNQLALVTEPGNPLHLTTLADLARPGLRVVLAGPTVPVGRAATKALAGAGVTVRPVSLEDAVTGVIGKVRLGEADAGIAYLSDLGHGVDGVALPGTTTDLVIGTLTTDGAGFMAFVLGPAGQRVLREHGFR
jgi:molybdate transport system substrate-binding protein